MQAFKITIKFEEKEGFTETGLKNAIINSLKESQLSLLSFYYQKDGYTLDCDVIPLSKTFSVCECIIEYKSFGIFPYHQIVLGGIMPLQYQGYPYFDIHSIDPVMIDIK